ncbi:MAG: thioesterase family protein, partial [Desulfobacteraceae bacterium]|nr:thioesterase family protein [Desulfobacteraceae bacterium]
SYSVENMDALDIDIDRWKTDTGFAPESAVKIATRPSDFDPLGHVNNALYFDYLETLIERVFQRPAEMSGIVVQFNREIPKDVFEAEAGLKKKEGGFIFKITSESGINAFGEWW